MLNVTFLQGRFVRDLEKRYTNSGKAVVSGTLAVDRAGKDAGTDFVDVVAFDKTADFLADHFGKGDMALVQGRLTSRNWEDKNGNKRTSWEVVVSNVNFCGGKRENGEFKPASAPVDVFTDAEEIIGGELPF